MAEVAPDIAAQLAALRDAYAATLPGKIGELVSAAEPLTGDASSDGARRALESTHALSHKLAGSVGTFGFDALGEAARAIENRCNAAMRDGEPVATASLGIETLLAELQRHGTEPTPDTPPPPKPAGREHPLDDPSNFVAVVAAASEDALNIEAALINFGFRTQISSGLEELAALADQPLAIVVDPGTNESADELRRKIPGIGVACPLVLVSESGAFDSRLQAVRESYDAYLVKPIEAGALVDVLDRLTTDVRAEPYRVLIVDDDPEAARHVEIVLRGADMIAESITDPMRAMERIEEFCPELILLDLNMPGCSGQELAAVIRQQDSLASTSIVFLSAESDVDRQFQAMSRGGDDFLAKSLKSEHLVAAVTGRARRFRGLRALMVRDSLTGLLNHTTTKQQLETEIARARREDAPLSFAIIDIDHFKAVNDTYGHAVGDRVIKTLARLLRQRLRATDVVGRLGGEEFGIALIGTPANIAVDLFEDIRREFSEIAFQAENRDFFVALSCGLADFPVFGNSTTLSDAADKALYEAKAGGRNRVVLAGGEDR